MRASRIILPLLLLASAVGPANALASENANWGTGVEVTPPANAAANPDVFISHLTCTSAGNCTVAGLYTDSSGDRQVFFLNEASGMWGTGQEAALPAGAAPNSEVGVGSLSCSSEGNCAAVGEYVDSSGEQQGVLWTETLGTWGAGLEAALPANAGSEPEVFIGQVSCQAAGNCTAAGRYSDSTESQQGLLLSETSGTWETGVEATLPANAAEPGAGVFMNGLSCPSAGNCTAVGNYSVSQGDYESFLLTETSGTWGAGVEATAPADAESRLFLDGVSCPSIGNCTAVGDYFDSKGNQGLLLSESSGVWGTGVKAPLPANGLSEPYVFIHTVQCASAGNCTAVGNYIANSTQGEGLLLTESSGKWATGVEAPVPANARTDPFVTGGALSCPSAGNCGVVHHYDDGASHFQGLLLTESSGSWGPGLEAALPANAAPNPEVSLGSVSCTSPDNCIAVGSYSDNSGHQQGLVLAAAPITPTLSANGPAGGFAGDPISASSISAALAEGSSPSGTITFTVFGPQASPPSSCTSGGTTLGTASASDGGTYHPSGAFTPATPGDYWWYASYGGDPSNNPAAAPCGAEMEETIVIPKATPTLSAAGPTGGLVDSPIAASSIAATLAGGSSATGTITFTVFGPQSSPPGSCASGGTTIGTADVSGDDVYRPSAGFTPTSAGEYWWYASYDGDAGDDAMASTCGPLMAQTAVIAATPILSLSAPATAAGTQPKGPAPTLARVKLAPRMLGAKRVLVLTLTVSQPARIEVLVTQTVGAHKPRSGCKPAVKNAKRCTTSVKRRTLTFSALAGSNTFQSKLAGLGKDSYTATIIADNANGKSSAVRLRCGASRCTPP